MWAWADNWTSTTPTLVLGIIVFALMVIAAFLGFWIRKRSNATAADDATGGTIATAVLTLLALLIGFSFNLAMERYEARRQLVIDEANAIGTAYLRAQLLPEPHRKRISDILIAYTDVRIALSDVSPDRAQSLLAKNDAVTTDLWAATSAALRSIDRPDFSNAFLNSTNSLIDIGATRKLARYTHVPGEIFIELFVFMIATAGVLGYILVGSLGRVTASLVLVLMTSFLLLVDDIDHPTHGGVQESQLPMTQLRDSLAAQPPSVFDRYRIADAKAQDARPAPGQDR